jgi:hypothetical protein
MQYLLTDVIQNDSNSSVLQLKLHVVLEVILQDHIRKEPEAYCHKIKL